MFREAIAFVAFLFVMATFVYILIPVMEEIFDAMLFASLDVGDGYFVGRSWFGTLRAVAFMWAPLILIGGVFVWFLVRPFRRRQFRGGSRR